MTGTWEIVVVGLVVATAGAWALRGMWRAGRRKKVCSSCASSGGCPLADGKVDKPVSSECLTPELTTLSAPEDPR